MADTINTVARLTITSSRSPASRAKTLRYKSCDTEEAVTSNCAEAVLMIAANTADQIKPATNGLNKCSLITRNTVSASASTRGVVKYTLPTRPTATAANKEITTQIMAIFVAFFNSFASEIAIKRTKI